MTPVPTSEEHESEAQIISEATGSRPGSLLRAISYANLDAEKVLTEFGTFGLYQMFVYAMANLGFFLFACETMIMSLITESPAFECRDPQITLNNTAGVCEYVDGPANVSRMCTNFEYPEGKHTFLTSEFDLVCGQAHYAEHSMSTFMLGSMFFTPILSQLADRYGRRITFLIPLWMAVIANIGCAFAPNYACFLVFRFVAGLGTAGIGTIGYVIVLEAVAPAFRSHTPFVSTLVWVGGYTTVGLVHMYVPTWRWQFFVLSAPFVLTFAFYWLLPESIHWLITHKKAHRVSSYIKQSSRFNRRQIDLEGCKSSAPSTPSSESTTHDDTRRHQRSFLDIFTNGPMMFQMVSHCLIMTVMNFTYWALSLYSVDLHENKMIGYFLSGFVELPAAGATFLLQYFGRRTVTTVSLLAQATLMFVAVFFPGKNIVAMTMFLLVKVFNSVSWMSEPLLIGEMSPTSTRNMFYGVVGFVGEIGSIVAPYFNRLKVIHELAPAVAIALMSLVAGLLSMCSPETMDRPMPEDIDDFNAGPVYNWIFGRKSRSSLVHNKTIAPSTLAVSSPTDKPLLQSIPEVEESSESDLNCA